MGKEHPDKLAEMQSLWLAQARENKALPIGGGLYIPLHPAEAKRSRNTAWLLDGETTRVPESQAPNVRNGNLRAEVDLRIPAHASGVLFALGGYAGGASLYVVDGELRYEYSALLIKRDSFRIAKLKPGEVKLAMEMRTPLGRAVPGELTFFVDGNEVAKRTVERTIPAAFTASETFDVGVDLNSPVANDYFDKAPFRFNGDIQRIEFKNL